MAEETTNYQCPACGGPLRYDGPSGKLKCDYCGSSYAPEEVEKLYSAKKSEEEKDWDYSSLNSEWGSDGEGMKTYTCPSCGASLVCDASTAVTQCPYCGNPAVIPGQFDGGLKPDYVIPFKLAKKQAEEALSKHYKGRPFLPKSFKDTNHIAEIQGVYVPFWLFDGKAEGGASYETTRTRVYMQGDDQVTETQHFHVYRSGSQTFEKVPVDGSEKMQDDYMDSIEPFDYGELKDFSVSYMPGYMADRYDVKAEECRKKADERCRNSLLNELDATVIGYEGVVRSSSSVSIQRGKVHYALMPVWILHTKWQNKDYLFMVNGQTGKMAGDLPSSPARLILTFFIITAVLTVIISLIYF